MIAHLLERRVADAPERAFLVTEHADYSFADVWRLARQLAGKLGERVRPGDHVALVAGNSAAYVVAFLGINFAGAVAVCLNNSLRSDSIHYLIEQCDAKLLITDREWEDLCAAELPADLAALPRMVIESEATFLASLGGLPQADPFIRKPQDGCTILYTSGTTGLPKGVVCPEASYVAGGRDMAELLDLGCEDRTMVFMPLFHTNPQIYALMPALHVGSSLIIGRRFSARSLFDDARRHGATGMTFVGSILAILAAHYPQPVLDHGLRYCVGGGTHKEMAAMIQARFGFRVYELYGMTETGGWATGSRLEDIRLGSNGRPRADLEIRIFDEDDRELGPGEKGEIVVRPRRPHVMFAGYYNKPEAYVAGLRNQWFHTGDMGSLDADGYLYFHGRRGDVIRRGGEMIAPDLIEAKLMTAPGVADCAVVGVPDPIMGMEIKAVVVATGAVAADSLIDHLAQHFPRNLLPRYVEFAASIPRTETAKIRRSELTHLDERVLDLAPARPPGGGTPPPAPAPTKS